MTQAGQGKGQNKAKNKLDQNKKKRQDAFNKVGERVGTEISCFLLVCPLDLYVYIPWMMTEFFCCD